MMCVQFSVLYCFNVGVAVIKAQTGCTFQRMAETGVCGARCVTVSFLPLIQDDVHVT